MRRFLLTVAAAATTLVGTACGDTTGLGNNGFAGSYELQTINGQGLPVSDQFSSVTFVAGELELDNDGSFIDIVQYRNSGSSLIQTTQTSGTWERSGNGIRLDYDDGFTFVGNRTSTNRLVLEDNDGNEWGYRRF